MRVTLAGAVVASAVFLTGCVTQVPTKHGVIKLYPPYDYDVKNERVTMNEHLINKGAELLEKGSDKALDRIQKIATQPPPERP